MYRIILIDDDVQSMDSLRSLVAADQRYEVISCFFDAQKALDEMERLLPDLSGIELIHATYAQGLYPEFIVTDDSADFDRKMQALKSGALDYQCKSYDAERIFNMLDNLYRHLEHKKAAIDVLIYEQLLGPCDHIADLLAKQYRYPLLPFFQVIMLHFRQGAMLLPFIDIEGAQFLHLDIGSNRILCLVNSAADLTDRLEAELKSISAGCIRVAGISSCSEEITCIHQLINQANNACYDTFVYPQQTIFRYKRPHNLMIASVDQRFQNAVDTKNYSLLEEMINDLPLLIKRNGMSASDMLVFWNRAALHSAKNGPDTPSIQPTLDLFELTDRFETIDEMCGHLRSILLPDEGEENSKSAAAFNRMIEYIDANYAQPLYLRELCNQFFINTSYCCMLFKRYKNMTFTQYLTDLRMRRACELLSSKQYSISEICEMTGYKDYFYFNKVFKKHQRCTPAEYRRLHAAQP